MIEFVFGGKGSGKTKKMIDMANAEVETTMGEILFINDRDQYRVSVDRNIRFINTEEFQINSVERLYGFLCGVIAGNYDIDRIYVDNLLRIICADGVEDVKPLLEKLNPIQKQYDVQFILSMSCEAEAFPEELKALAE